MTNKTTHHVSQRVFCQQADTLTVQQFPTKGLVLTDKRTTGGGYAGLPHAHPLDAEHVFVISRASVRQPAQETPCSHDDAPTHTRLSEKGSERLLHKGEGVSLPNPGSQSTTSSGTSSTRPHIGDIRHTVVAPHEGKAPIDRDSSRKAFTHENLGV